MQKLIIIGSGFAGWAAYKNLFRSRDQHKLKVELYDSRGGLLYTPYLNHLAIGVAQWDQVFYKLDQLPTDSRFKTFQSEVTNVDLEAKSITIADKIVSYDYLVIATGSETNFFNIAQTPLVAGFKNVEDITRIRERLEDFLLDADSNFSRNSSRSIGQRPDHVPDQVPKVVIVGGGPDGVKMSAEVADLFRVKKRQIEVTLIHSRAELLPDFRVSNRKFARNRLESKGVNLLFNAKAERIDSELVILNTGEKLQADLVIWTAGVKPNSPVGLDIYTVAGHRIPATKALQSLDNPEVFVVGDEAGVRETADHDYPLLAQIALRQGKFVAKNVVNLSQGKDLEDFNYQTIGQMLSVGRFGAAGFFLNFAINGLLASVIWHIIYLYYLPDYRQAPKVISNWLNYYLLRKTNFAN